jgi:hypothetical protein
MSRNDVPHGISSPRSAAAGEPSCLRVDGVIGEPRSAPAPCDCPDAHAQSWEAHWIDVGGEG